MGLAGWGVLGAISIHIAIWAVCGVVTFDHVDPPDGGLFDFLGSSAKFVAGLVDFVLLLSIDDCFGAGMAFFIRLFLGLVWAMVLIGAVLGVAFD